MSRRSVSLFVPILLACLLAYLLPAQVRYRSFFTIAAIGLTLLTGIWQFQLSTVRKFRFRWIYLALICTGVFSTSIAQRMLIRAQKPSSDVLNRIQQAGWYEMVVSKHPNASKLNICECRIVGLPENIAGTIPWFHAGCNVELDSNYPLVGIGDTLYLNVDLRSFNDTLLPGVFNYGDYLKSKDVYWTAFAPARKILAHRTNQRRNAAQGLAQRREDLLRYFERIRLSRESASMMVALVLGEKSLMERDVKMAFQRSGGAHLLAVSGMHMGIIYWLLNFLLGSVRKWKRGDLFYFIALSSGLWSFALIAGFGPSVRRACLLFTLVLINKLLRRRTGTFHILLSAVFVLIVLFPELPIDPGFQLSVVATMGIILFYLPIQKHIAVRNRVVKPVLELILVSIAAQLAVAPLCIYLFHQFQFLFILTNLLLTPLITLLMFWGLIVLALGWINPVATVWTTVSDGLVAGVRAGNGLVSGFEHAFVSAIPMPASELVWWSALLILIACVPFFRHRRWITIGILCCAFRILIDVYQIYLDRKGPDIHILTWNRGSHKAKCLRLGSEYLVLSKGHMSEERIKSDLDSYALRMEGAEVPNVRFVEKEYQNFMTKKHIRVQLIEKSTKSPGNGTY